MPGKTGHLGLLMLAMAVGSCYLSYLPRFKKTCCKYCRGFYDNNPYCFRLKSLSIILRSRSLSRSKSSSEESYSGSNHGSEFDESVPQVAEVVIVSDKHGPPVDLSKQDKFYSTKKEY